MVLVNEMPKNGQFVAIWKNSKNGDLWCDTLKWKGGVLHEYINDTDEFVEVFDDSHLKDAKYIISV